MRFLIYPLSALVRMALWLWVIIRAFQGQKVSLPVIGDIAERFSKAPRRRPEAMPEGGGGAAGLYGRDGGLSGGSAARA